MSLGALTSVSVQNSLLCRRHPLGRRPGREIAWSLDLERAVGMTARMKRPLHFQQRDRLGLGAALASRTRRRARCGGSFDDDLDIAKICPRRRWSATPEFSQLESDFKSLPEPVAGSSRNFGEAPPPANFLAREGA